MEVTESPENLVVVYLYCSTSSHNYPRKSSEISKAATAVQAKFPWSFINVFKLPSPMKPRGDVIARAQSSLDS